MLGLIIYVMFGICFAAFLIRYYPQLMGESEDEPLMLAVSCMFLWPFYAFCYTLYALAKATVYIAGRIT